MRCRYCVKDGKESNLYLKNSSSTDMAGQTFYGKDGLFHDHDPNWHSEEYQCSNGHKFMRGILTGCKACGKEDEFTFELI